jgi:hypothetical protein
MSYQEVERVDWAAVPLTGGVRYLGIVLTAFCLFLQKMFQNGNI